ncbi:translocation/assembly module TamB domain-containing protein [Candidatus Methylocalor cossyra]|uniref:Autotransporter translocation and assembly factor TamB n=1 Tax=Candidatus Methylocalor cossyra TaxID=3108543 RepID=A0ABP1C7G8_9GAMM
MKRVSLGILAAFPLLLMSLAGALYWLLASEPGLRWLVRAIHAQLPGFTVEDAQGSLLGGFVVRGLSYRDAATEARLERLEVRWEPRALWQRRLHIHAVRAEGVQLTRLGAASAEPPSWPQWKLPLAVAVDQLQLSEVLVRGAAGAEPLRIERLEAAAAVDQERLRLARFQLVLPELALGLAGAVGLSGERRVDLTTDWRLTLAGRPELRGSGTLAGDPARLYLQQRLQAPVAAELAVELRNPLGAPAWTLQLTVPRFLPTALDPALKPWPLELRLEGQGTATEAAVTGTMAATIAELGGELGGRLRARWQAPDQVTVETLALSLPRTGTEWVLDGTARKLGDNPQLNLTARWRNLLWPPDPKAPWRSPEGRLTVVGSLRDLRFELRGLLRERPVEAGGTVGIASDRVRFQGVRVRGAGTALALEGELGPQLELSWTLRAEDLGLWLPGAQGFLDTHGRLKGSREAPSVAAELRARGLALGDNGVAALQLHLSAGAAADAPFAFELTADRLRAAGQRADAHLWGRGTRADHRLAGQITASTPAVGLVLQAQGGWRDRAWAGTVQRVDFALPSAGRWFLARPAALRLGPAGGELGSACWQSGEGAACLRGRWSAAGSWEGGAELSHLSLARFQSLWPPRTTVAGTLNATARLSGRGQRVEAGRLSLEVADAALTYQAGPQQTLRFQPAPLSLRASLSERGGELNGVAEQPGLAALRAQLTLAGPVQLDRLERAPLAGELTLRLSTLAVLAPWVQELSNLKGSLEGRLGLSGSLAAPALELQAQVPDAGFTVPRLGIEVRRLQLTARSPAPDQLQVQGRAQSGAGELILEGGGTLSDAAGWPLHLSLKGDRFLAADLPEAKVYLSPDLSLSHAAGKLALTGTVTIPEAKLQIPEQQGAVKPSEDVVLVGGAAPERGVPLETRLDVVLGPAVQVQGFGFQGRTDGHLLIEQAPNGPVLGTGQVAIHDGKYALYGIELAIDDGRVLFAHSPVDNPSLDIRATRRAENVLAGVKVQGTLKKPAVTLFSDTPMSQTDILAYLLTGKPLGMTSQQEGGLLQSAAVGLGGSAGSFLAREVSNRLGLGEFVDISVGSAAATGPFSTRATAVGATPTQTAQNTSLFLGKYLTPRLYVQYGVGLLHNSNVFRLRYRLSRRWYVQTETGEYNGGDLLYQWEK